MRTIDRNSPDHAAAVSESRSARHYAQAALEARNLSRFYSGKDHGVDPTDAERRIGQLLAETLADSLDESKALRRLNDALISAGGQPGNEFLVDGQVYRVAGRGNVAVHLGRDIPDSEIEAAFANPDEETDREAMADRQRDFAEMVHLPR